MELFGDFSKTITKPTALKDNEFNELREIIYRNTGLYFPETKRYLLETRIYQRMRALQINEPIEYLRILRKDGEQGEFPQLVNSITINETYFFRNEFQLKAFEESILPEVIEHRQQGIKKYIRIWSAGCSSGEEPYTLAMIIKERIQPRYPDVNFQIWGTDINTSVLKKAEKGVYREYSIRRMPTRYLNKFFTRKNDLYILDETIRKMVFFKHLNLLDKQKMDVMRMFDIIFCANVLIYFDEEAKRKVVASLYDALNPGGYLLMGYSEVMYGVSQAFKPVHFNRAIGYKKE